MEANATNGEVLIERVRLISRAGIHSLVDDAQSAHHLATRRRR